MEILLNVLQGSYAYLLVFQILVITLLVLSLIWLTAKRMQQAHDLAGASSASLSAEPTTSIKADAALAEKITELEGKLVALEEQNKGLKTASGDAPALKEKIKYLESKLLEYEILQEEIGTLSALKVENEHLKQELMSAKSGKATPAEVSAGALLFDAPARPAPPKAMPSGETAVAGLESLLAQIDDLGGSPDKA